MPSEGDSGAALGAFIRRLTDTPHPMGHWTGLPPLPGAPISGALLGAGGGLLYGGYKKLTEDPNNPEPKKSLLKKTLLGALIGGGIGTASGIAQNAKMAHSKESMFRSRAPTSPSPQAVLEMLHTDRYLSYADKQKLMQGLSQASPSQWSTLMAMAAGGALTGAAAAKILGVGLFGTTLAAGAGALVFRNLFGQPTTFV